MNFLVKYWIVLIAALIDQGRSVDFIEENVTLTIDQGTLFGERLSNYNQEIFYSFKGIPYAKPPIGALRFKAPEPAEPWTGVYNATQTRFMCPQIESKELESIFALEGLDYNEDCLFLNVHTKMSRELRPVMVWIHGGGLSYGSIFEASYGPELLLTEDIVLVQVAYRLNIFGFLSFEDPKYDIPGNAGLKDQVMALKWIQKNIHHFGGDPAQVTISGQSAGGASVHYLTVSPLAKGLFHRGIAQSGAIDNPWLMSPNKYPELARILECHSEKLDEIVQCINGTSTDSLLDAFGEMYKSEEFTKHLRNGEVMIFNSITIEKPHPNSFLSDNPENIIQSGQYNTVPMIFGFTSQDGEIAINCNTIEPDLTDYRQFIPRDIPIDLESEEAYLLGEKIKEFYYGSQKPSYDSLDNYTDYLTDTFTSEKMFKYAKLQANTVKTVPIYFYQFDLFTKLNYNYNTSTVKRIVTHFDDVRYLFYHKNVTPNHLNHQSKEFIGMYRMIKLWTTFATSKNGDPNPMNDSLVHVKWLPIESNQFNYLKISDDLELKRDPIDKRMQFWDEIYAHYVQDHQMVCESANEQC